MKTTLGALKGLRLDPDFPKHPWEHPGSSMGAEHTTRGFEVAAVVHLHDHIPQGPEDRTLGTWDSANCGWGAQTNLSRRSFLPSTGEATSFT